MGAEGSSTASIPLSSAAEDALDFSVISAFRAKGDGLATKTLADQEECEQSCALFFFPLELLPVDQQLQLQDIGFSNTELQASLYREGPLLMREKHVQFLLRGLSRLPPGFVSLDASRPWIVYWILHSLELLDALPEDKFGQTIDTLKACWNSSVELDSEDKGGFGGGPMQLGHTATNYASCLALALIGTPAALESVDRHALYRFFLSRKHAPTGAFTAHDGGEADVRVTYCVVSIARLYGILTPELAAGVVEYVVSCQTYEGGFGGEPGNEAHGGYAFCAVATLWLLDALDQVRDMDALLYWLANRQMPFEGGYQGRTNKLVDGCYSFWQGALPALLADTIRARYGDEQDDSELPFQCHRAQLQKYILLCGQQVEGGLRDKPGKPRDHYHTCYCLSGLSIAQHGALNNQSAPVVAGDSRNLLKRTHPAFNIGVDKVENARAYFDAKGPFDPSASSR